MQLAGVPRMSCDSMIGVHVCVRSAGAFSLHIEFFFVLHACTCVLYMLLDKGIACNIFSCTVFCLLFFSCRREEPAHSYWLRPEFPFFLFFPFNFIGKSTAAPIQRSEEVIDQQLAIGYRTVGFRPVRSTLPNGRQDSHPVQCLINIWSWHACMHKDFFIKERVRALIIRSQANDYSQKNYKSS